MNIDEITESIKKLIAEINFGTTEDYSETDWAHLLENNILDSFAVVYLISLIEDAFCIHLPVSDLKLESFNSTQQIAQLVKRQII